MSKLRVGVLGVGGLGASHVRDVAASPNMELAAVCDANPQILEAVGSQYGVAGFADHAKLLGSGKVDGIIIATPHPFHVEQAIAAFEKGVHVLVEKPIAVHVKEARRMVQAYERAKSSHPGLVFAAMFMQRTYGHWKKIREMVNNGDLGRLVRATWIITDWFRTQYYYDTGGWRATWEGEGGGVLLNQCPHNLDLYQWVVGMPSSVRGFASIAKYHNIEVEDEVTAYFEHRAPDGGPGMIGHFITTTGEYPGTNRLEIVGEKGKLIYEGGAITFFKNQRSMLDIIRDVPERFPKLEYETVDISYTNHGESGHRLVIENFAAAVDGREELVAPAVEGVNSLMLANAAMLSSFQGREIDLPIDEEAYERKLQELIADTKEHQK